MWPLLEEVTQGFWLLVFWSWSRRSDGSFCRLEFSYETNKLIKCLVNIHSILCGTFNEGGFKLLGHILALRPRHLKIFQNISKSPQTNSAQTNEARTCLFFSKSALFATISIGNSSLSFTLRTWNYGGSSNSFIDTVPDIWVRPLSKCLH